MISLDETAKDYTFYRVFDNKNCSASVCLKLSRDLVIRTLWQVTDEIK